MFAIRTDLVERSGLALLGASSVAIAIPLFATLADGVSFFIAHNTGRSELLWFTALVYLGPAFALLSVIWLATRFGAKPRAAVTLLCFAFLGTLWLLAWVKQWPPLLALLAASFGAGLFCFCLARSELFTSILRMLGLVSPVVPIAFLWFSPLSALMTNASGETFALQNQQETAAKVAYPVVFVVLDELSLSSMLSTTEKIDAGRLPNFNRIARLSTWYRNATTVSSLTDTAVPAVLSGLYPDGERAPVYQHYPQNLFTALSNTHQMFVTETVTRLCPRTLCGPDAKPEPGRTANALRNDQAKADSFLSLLKDVRVVFWHLVFPKALADKHLPSLSDRWSQFSAQRKAVSGQKIAQWTAKDMAEHTDKSFGGFIHGVASLQQAQLHYFHLSLPHHPWNRLPNGMSYNGVTELGRANGGYAWNDQAELVEQAEIRYLLQLEYVDKLLGELLDSLQKSPVFDDMMLVVVADHGLTFLPEASVRVPSTQSLADIARIPLFIKYPGQTTGRVNDWPAQTIDLLPTVANVVGLKQPRGVDGQSLIGGNLSNPVRRIYEGEIGPAQFEQVLQASGAAPRVAIRDGESILAAGMAQGSLKALLGRSRAELSIDGQATFYGTVLNSHWYQHVDLNSHFLPVRLAARFDALHSDVDMLALLNGRVAGSAVSHDNGKALSLLLSPAYFQQGQNRLQLLAKVNGKLLQVPLQATLNDISWAYQADGQTFQSITVDGRSWSADQSSDLGGRADINTKGTGSVGGWAYDFNSKKAAQRVLLFQGDRLLNSIPRRFALLSFGGDYEEFAPNSQPGFSFALNRVSSPYRVVALFDQQKFKEITVGDSRQQEKKIQ